MGCLTRSKRPSAKYVPSTHPSAFAARRCMSKCRGTKTAPIAVVVMAALILAIWPRVRAYACIQPITKPLSPPPMVPLSQHLMTNRSIILMIRWGRSKKSCRASRAGICQMTKCSFLRRQVKACLSALFKRASLIRAGCRLMHNYRFFGLCGRAMARNDVTRFLSANPEYPH